MASVIRINFEMVMATSVCLQKQVLARCAVDHRYCRYRSFNNHDLGSMHVARVVKEGGNFKSSPEPRE